MTTVNRRRVFIVHTLWFIVPTSSFIVQATPIFAPRFMNSIINLAVKQYLSRRMKRIERYMMHPEEAQERWLLRLLDRARDTEQGCLLYTS